MISNCTRGLERIKGDCRCEANYGPGLNLRAAFQKWPRVCPEGVAPRAPKVNAKQNETKNSSAHFSAHRVAVTMTARSVFFTPSVCFVERAPMTRFSCLVKATSVKMNVEPAERERKSERARENMASVSSSEHPV